MTHIRMYILKVHNSKQDLCSASFRDIKTHDSESRGQEEAGRTRRMSVLLTGSTAVKLVNALNKPPLKLSLSYQRLSTF